MSLQSAAVLQFRAWVSPARRHGTSGSPDLPKVLSELACSRASYTKYQVFHALKKNILGISGIDSLEIKLHKIAK